MHQNIESQMMRDMIVQHMQKRLNQGPGLEIKKEQAYESFFAEEDKRKRSQMTIAQIKGTDSD